MKNTMAKVLLIVFILQLLAQIVLLTGANSFGFLVIPFETQSSSTSGTASSSSTPSKLTGISGTSVGNLKASLKALPQSQKTPESSSLDQSSKTQTTATGSSTAQDSQSLQTNAVFSAQAIGGTPNPISLYASNYKYLSSSYSMSLNVGYPGNNRLIVIFVSVESTSSEFPTTGITVGNYYSKQPATLIYKLQNTNSVGNHLEIWTISESGLGNLQGNDYVYVSSSVPSISSYGITAMTFYGVYDSPYPYDLQNGTSVGITTVTAENVTIPHNGLAVFGAGQGYGSGVYYSSFASNDGSSPTISMTKTSDFITNSAGLASAYYTLPSTYSNATNRRLVATTNSNPYRQTGIVATFLPYNVHTFHTATINPDKDYLTGLTGSSGGSHSALVNDTSTSTYVFSTSTNYDIYNLSTATTVANSTITSVTVYAKGDALTTFTNGWFLAQLGKNYGSWDSGHNQVIYSATGTYDTFQNVFYTSYTGKAWQWSDLSGMNLRLYDNNLNITKVYVEIQYILLPGVSSISISPTSPKTTDTLTASYTYIPADGYSESTTTRQIYWYKDNVLQPALNNSKTVGPGNTSKGETWRYQISVSDGEYNSSLYNSTSVTIQDTPSTITSASILPLGATTTDNLTANYTYSDVDTGDTVQAVNITWYLNNVYQPSLNNVTTVLSGNTTKNQNWQFKINIFDGQYWSASQTGGLYYNVILNSAPVVHSVTLGPALTFSNGSLTLSNSTTDADPGDTIFYTVLWYKNGVLVPTLNNQTTVPTSYLKHFDIWNATVEAWDGYNYSSVVWSNSITIQNSQTVISNIYISPTTAYNTSNLFANYTTFDKDGDPIVNTTIAWYRDRSGTLTQFANGTEILATNTAKGDIWYFTIVINDGYSNSSVYTSSNLTILNTPPVLSNVVINNNVTTVTTGTTLYANFTYYDADLDANQSTTIYWYYIYTGLTYNESSRTNQWTIPGTLVNGSTWYWYYQVMVYDGENYSIQYTSSVITVGGSPTNTPPTVTYLNLTIVGANSTLSQLYANYTYYDSDGDNQSGSVLTWFKNGSPTPAYTSTCDGTTSCQYLPASYTSKGDSWYVVVKVKDGIQFASSSNTSNTIVIGNTLPWITGIQLTPSSPTTTQDLTLAYYWHDVDSSDTNHSIISWYLNGVNQTSLVGNISIPYTLTQKGQNWTVYIVAGDGTGYNSTIFGLGYNITIIDTAPVLTSVNLSPSTPYTTDNLTANFNFSDIDGDSQSGTIIYWYLFNVYQPQLTNQTTITSGNTTKGQVWYFIVKPSDGQLYGLNYTSNYIIIQNSPPTVSNILINGATNPIVYSNGSLTLTYSYSDADNDTQSGTTITWYKNGAPQNALTGSLTVSSIDLVTGDSWYVVIIPKDGSTFGSTYNFSLIYGNVITIRNTAPQIKSGYISPTTPTTSSILTLNYQYYDYDGSPQNLSSLQVIWYLNGTQVSAFNNVTSIPSTNTTKGEVWSARVRVSDGTNYSNWFWTINVTIKNSPPILSNVVVTPSQLFTTNNLTASYTVFDADNDTVTLYSIYWYQVGITKSIYWYKQGSNATLTNITSALVLNSTFTQEFQYFYFTIVVTDGTNQSITYTSSNYYIRNSPPIVKNLQYGSTHVLSNGTITISFSTSDADNNFVITSIFWYQNGVLVPALNNLTSVPSSYLIFNDVWNVSVVPFDGKSYGLIYNLSIITIGNTPPTASGYTIGSNVGTSANLTLNYNYNDIDNQANVTSKLQVEWYRYRHSIWTSFFTNSTIFSNQSTQKGDIIYARFRVFDGYNYSIWYQTANITIIDTAPVATAVYLAPETTGVSLYVNYTYYDIDGDVNATPIIHWYKFVSGGYILQSAYDNMTSLPTSATAYGDYWHYEVIPYDGQDYGLAYTSPNVQILDTAPVASNVQILPTTVLSNGTLSFNYSFYDIDGQTNQTPIVYWYKTNSTGQYLMTQFTNSLTISSSALFMNDTWIVSIRPYDGILYGVAVNSTVPVLIHNTPPTVSNIVFVNSQNNQFYVEDQNISVSFTYFDTDANANRSKLTWYDNGTLVGALNGSYVVPYTYLTPNDTWTVVVRSFDGFNYGNVLTQSIKIESEPEIYNLGLDNITNSQGVASSEGLYTVWFNVSDLLHPINSTTITLTIVKDNIAQHYTISGPNATGSNVYTQNINIIDLLTKAGFTASDYRNLVGTTMTIQVQASTQVFYNHQFYTITNSKTFTLTIHDDAPPRVVNAYYQWNSATNPTSLTFYAEVQDFGSNISSVTLYYYFQNSTLTTSTAPAALGKLSQSSINYLSVQMVKMNATFYTYTVKFTPKQATDVLFNVGVVDSSGNSNQNAYPEGSSQVVIKSGRFVPPSSGGLPTELVVGIIAVVLIVALLFTFVGIKKFRSTELVGLDKDLVMSKIKDIKNDNEVITQLDLHTLGIITSFFDQRHGPIPIIVTPDILQDNYNLLVDLSDMSFSSARFSGNFEDEIYSTYNFNPGPGQFINIISFGFALDRPDARGGAENITLNILLHKNVSELINQFIDKFQDRIHEIHVLMDKHGNDKEAISQKIKELRIFLSKIVITYEKLYGTTELLDSYDEIFDN